jgi:hypothetical protein
MEIGAGQYQGGPSCCHVVGADRVAPGLWRVLVKWNGKNLWSCATVQLDRFYIHSSGGTVSDGGYAATPGHCPTKTG